MKNAFVDDKHKWFLQVAFNEIGLRGWLLLVWGEIIERERERDKGVGVPCCLVWGF